MDDRAQVFVRQELVPQRKAPVRTTGAIAWIQSRLFGSPTSILLTIVVGAAAVFHGRSRDPIPAGRRGLDRAATATRVCPKKSDAPSAPAGRSCRRNSSSSCTASIRQNQLWRPNLVFVAAVILLIPLLIPRIPGKTLNAVAVLLCLAYRCVLSAAWRRHQGLWHQLGVRHARTRSRRALPTVDGGCG